MERTCPHCRASLDDDLAERTGEAHCPFCGKDVSALYDSDGFHVSSSGRQVDDDDRAPPPGILEVVEWTDDRLVIAIPPGGTGMKGMGCFAVVWLGITVVVGMGFVAGGIGGGFQWELIFPFVIIALFLAIGLGMLYAVVRARYMTTYLLLERDRLAVQRILFGRKSTTVTHLNGKSQARLETSFEQNDQPVYHIEIKGSNRQEKFGVRLGDEEKQWLTRACNAFLHGEEMRPTSGRDDKLDAITRFRDQIPDEDVPPLRTHELPPDSIIRVEEEIDGLRFSYPMFAGSFATGCTWGCGCFGSIWMTVCALIAYFSLNADGQIVALLIPILMAIPGFLAVLVGAAARVARTTVRIELDGVHIRWGWGVPLGNSKFLPYGSITHVGVGTTMTTSSEGNVKHRSRGAIIRGGGTSYPLSWGHDEAVARQIGGLVRAAVEDRGVVLAEIGTGEDVESDDSGVDRG